jgi:hypothetical protein
VDKFYYHVAEDYAHAARLMAAAPELHRTLTRLVLFERRDETFLALLADESASRKEVPTTAVWRQRLLEEAEKALAQVAEVSR